MAGPVNRDDFHLFTTFRVDASLSSDPNHISICGGRQSNVYLLPYHFDRLKTAAASIEGFRCPKSMSTLEAFEGKILEAVTTPSLGASISQPSSNDKPEAGHVCRGKVSWWPDGRLKVTLLPMPQAFPILLPRSFDNPPAPLWTAVLDKQSTRSNLYTEIKTSLRADYDRARQDAELDPKSTTEVLLYNNDGEVMDGSITTAYFYRDDKWVTPDSGGLEGVTRRFALETGLCSRVSPAVSSSSLVDGEIVWLSNAFRGFYTATFRA